MDTRMSARELYERGRMLRQAKMYDRALADFRSVIQDPNYVGKAHTQAALCFRAMSRHGEAAAALEKALASSTLSLNEQMHVLYLLTDPGIVRTERGSTGSLWLGSASGRRISRCRRSDQTALWKPSTCHLLDPCVQINRFAGYLPLSSPQESVAAQLEAATGKLDE